MNHTQDESLVETETRVVRDGLRRHLTGRYSVLDLVGRGSSALVFAATDVCHDRLVALKVLAPETASPVTERRFQREVRLIASLKHPNILPLYDSGKAGELLYYVAPYVDGESLRTRLKRTPHIPLDEAMVIARDVGTALDYSHRCGIIHRDVKPGNILLSRARAFLGDFGVALPMRSTTSEALTQTGMGSPGTPLYMSPEQPIGAALDGRSDTYSLGLVLFEMLAGQLPFQGEGGLSSYAWRYSAEPPSIRRLRPDVPFAIDRALQRALRLEPRDRFASAAEFVAAISVS
jgi:serine/threonine-protein kinase